MEKDYLYGGVNGGNTLGAKRPWELVDYTQPCLAGQWQDEGKRLCLPGALGNTKTQMQLPSDTHPLLPNPTSDPVAFVEAGMDLSCVTELPGPFWGNDGSGASPLNLQDSLKSWTRHSFQPAASSPRPFDAFNNSEEMQTFQNPSGILNKSPECLEMGSTLYSRSCMRDYLVDDSQTPLTHLGFPTSDILGPPSSIGLRNQHSEFGNDISLMVVGFSDDESLNLPIGTDSWRWPDQLPTRTPQLQIWPTGNDLVNSYGVPESTSMPNEDRSLHRYLVDDPTIRIDYHSTESEASKAVSVEPQRLGSFSGGSTPSENVTTPLGDDSKNLFCLESVLSTQFENTTPQNELAEDCSLQTQVAPKQETLENTLSEKGGQINDISYDTCFGMVRIRSLKGNFKTQEYYS